MRALLSLHEHVWSTIGCTGKGGICTHQVVGTWIQSELARILGILGVLGTLGAVGVSKCKGGLVITAKMGRRWVDDTWVLWLAA